MAAPLKPWEQSQTANILNRHVPGIAPLNNYMSATSPQDQILGSGGLSGGSAQPRVTPPIPPRPQQQQQQQQTGAFSRYGGYGGYSNMYSSPYSSMYSSPYSSSYGGYGGYGGHGGYGGYNRYPGHTDNYGSGGFVQIAEESSQQAFQSIESIVHAVGSVSMMLESTFHAVYSSFRAVIGVADHFSRMKAQLGQIFSIFALFRALRWLYRRALYLLGLRKDDPRSEKVWAAMSSAANNVGTLSENDLKQNKFNWPILMFFAMVFGTPWLIWKLLSSVTRLSTPDNDDWAIGKADHFVANATYDFIAENEQEISVRAGQEVLLAPKEAQPKVRGWLLGSVNGQKGLIPATYLQILGKRKGYIADSNSHVGPVNEANFEVSFQDVQPSPV